MFRQLPNSPYRFNPKFKSKFQTQPTESKDTADESQEAQLNNSQTAEINAVVNEVVSGVKLSDFDETSSSANDTIIDANAIDNKKEKSTSTEKSAEEKRAIGKTNNIGIQIITSEEQHKPVKKHKSKNGDKMFDRGRTLTVERNDRNKLKPRTNSKKDVDVKDKPVKTADDRDLSPLKRAESVITITPKYNMFGSRSRSRSPVPSRSPSPDRRNSMSDALVTSDSSSTSLTYSDSIFAPITNRVYNATQLHELLISSSVVSTQKITSFPSIPKSQMIFDDISQLDDRKIFKVGYTFKDCSYTPITHGSLVFQDVETNKFIVIGRQNNQFLKPNRHDEDIWYSTWVATYMVNPYTLIHFTETHMDNEMKYHFFPGTPFNAEMTEVLMTGAQIKALMKDIDKNICTAQSYDLVHSNCYSAVIYGLTKIFTMIEGVTVDTYEETVAVNKDLKRIFTLICRALQDNFKAGSGTINNTVVNLAVQNIIDILEKRDMLHIVDKTITQDAEVQTNQFACKK